MKSESRHTYARVIVSWYPPASSLTVPWASLSRVIPVRRRGRASSGPCRSTCQVPTARWAWCVHSGLGSVRARKRVTRSSSSSLVGQGIGGGNYHDVHDRDSLFPGGPKLVLAIRAREAQGACSGRTSFDRPALAAAVRLRQFSRTPAAPSDRE